MNRVQVMMCTQAKSTSLNQCLLSLKQWQSQRMIMKIMLINEIDITRYRQSLDKITSRQEIIDEIVAKNIIP